MKPLMKRTVILLGLIVFLTFSCEKREPESQALNVSFTPCKQSKLRSSVPLNKVDVEFTGKSVQISYFDFEVTCDFTKVNVTFIFENGFLSITQQGSPNRAKCICYTDVSYTINGISQDEVNVIFINGMQVYCYNGNENKGEDVPFIPCPCEFDIEPEPIEGYARFFIDTFSERDSMHLIRWVSNRDVATLMLLRGVPSTLPIGNMQVEVGICNFPDFAKQWYSDDGITVYYEGIVYRRPCVELTGICRQFCYTMILTKLKIQEL
jgi:hypothetical protein